MESLFFNITDTRYRITPLLDKKDAFMQRVDISNGLLFFEGSLLESSEQIVLENIDAFVMIVLVKRGQCRIDDRIDGVQSTVEEGRVAIFCSSRQDMTIHFAKEGRTEFFILFIADFFLKRYLSGNKEEPIDMLYRHLRGDVSLLLIDQKPTDALTLYLTQKIVAVKSSPLMKSLKVQEYLIEFMIHRFGLLDTVSETISTEERRLAARARAILLKDFVHPPSIDEIAHRCATNSSKLKKVFKKVYQTTIYGYVQKLRLEEANILLKERCMGIGEVARRVGYRHQGYFSKLFFETYGVYPKALLKKSPEKFR